MRTPAPGLGRATAPQIVVHKSYDCHVGLSSINIRQNDRLTGQIIGFRETRKGKLAFVEFTSVRLRENGRLLNPPAALQLNQQVEVEITQLQQFGSTLYIDLALVPAAKK